MSAFKAALEEDTSNVIVALGHLSESELEAVVDAAQYLDQQGQWFLENMDWSRGEHEAEGRAVEAHQEAKHGDW